MIWGALSKLAPDIMQNQPQDVKLLGFTLRLPKILNWHGRATQTTYESSWPGGVLNLSLRRLKTMLIHLLTVYFGMLHAAILPTG